MNLIGLGLACAQLFSLQSPVDHVVPLNRARYSPEIAIQLISHVPHTSIMIPYMASSRNWTGREHFDFLLRLEKKMDAETNHTLRSELHAVARVSAYRLFLSTNVTEWKSILRKIKVSSSHASRSGSQRPQGEWVRRIVRNRLFPLLLEIQSGEKIYQIGQKLGIPASEMSPLSSDAITSSARLHTAVMEMLDDPIYLEVWPQLNRLREDLEFLSWANTTPRSHLRKSTFLSSLSRKQVDEVLKAIQRIDLSLEKIGGTDLKSRARLSTAFGEYVLQIFEEFKAKYRDPRVLAHIWALLSYGAPAEFTADSLISVGLSRMWSRFGGDAKYFESFAGAVSLYATLELMNMQDFPLAGELIAFLLGESGLSADIVRGYFQRELGSVGERRAQTIRILQGSGERAENTLAWLANRHEYFPFSPLDTARSVLVAQAQISRLLGIEKSEGLISSKPPDHLDSSPGRVAAGP